MLTQIRLAAVVAVALVLAGPIAARAGVPAPRDVLGFAPGEDRKLASYAQIAEYFTRLAATSDRVRLERIGSSTLGRPMLLATISSPANLARLDRLKEVQRRLADPRTIATDDEAKALVAEDVAVVLITCGVHSTEVGSTLSSTVIAHRLATDTSPATLEMLDRCVVLIVPSLNPDGVDIVKTWYDASLGTPWEGSDPVELYHHYVGHDDNRDWYAFTQAETRAVVDRVHNVWHPHVVNDIHQQGAYGSRLFLPPYLDPIEPNVPPELVAGANAIGESVAWALTASGRRGVVTSAIYDGWTPARAYSHYHGGIRVLSETASAKIATPLEVRPDELRAGRGYDPRHASVNFPAPWPGGTWRLADIVDYMTTAAMALLHDAAANKARLVEGFYRIGVGAVTHAAGEPVAYVIPAQQVTASDGSPLALAVQRNASDALVSTLIRGGVEVRRALLPFVAGGRAFPAGSLIVDFDQPYGGFARILLEKQDYPDIRAYQGGPPVQPYDVTAHTLALLMGVDAVRIDTAMSGVVTAPVQAPADEPPAIGSGRLKWRRVGLYRGATAPIDEGWTRWVFDRWHVGSIRLDEAQVRAGKLRDRFDVIVLPDMDAADIAVGRLAGTAPPAMTGGLGKEGAAALVEFVEQGGTLVALNRSTGYAIRALDLPVTDALSGMPQNQFYCPGSILNMEIAAPGNAITRGVPARTIAWFEDGPGFEVREGAQNVAVLARFAPADRLLGSGWLLGSDKLAGRPAILEIGKGKGTVVLFGFRPQYRGQSLATLPLFLNALIESP